MEALFNDIVFTIDLTGVDCHEAGYSHLCVTLDSSLACAESWCQSPEAVDTMCTPIFCSCELKFKTWRSWLSGVDHWTQALVLSVAECEFEADHDI